MLDQASICWARHKIFIFLQYPSRCITSCRGKSVDGVFRIALADTLSNTSVIKSTFRCSLSGQINWSTVTRFLENPSGFWRARGWIKAQRSSKIQVPFPSTIDHTILSSSLDLTCWIPRQRLEHQRLGGELANDTLGKYFTLSICTHKARALLTSLHPSLRIKL